MFDDSYSLAPLKPDDEAVLGDAELKIIKSLISNGAKLINDLKSPRTYAEIDSLVRDYAKDIVKYNVMLETVTFNFLKSNPGLSVRIDNIVRFANELIDARKRALVTNKYFKGAIERLKNLLLKYGVNLKMDYDLKFTLKKSSIKGNTFYLNLNESSINHLILLLLRNKEEFIKDEFLKHEHKLLEASKIESLLNKVSVQNINACLNRNPKVLENIILSAYVLLDESRKALLELERFVVQNFTPNNDSEFNLKYQMIVKRLSNDVFLIKQRLSIINDLIERGLILTEIAPIESIDELSDNTESIIKSWLLTKISVPNLIEQIAYEYLSVYGQVTELSHLNDYKMRSPYLMYRKLFT